MARACIGFVDERGNISACASPSENSMFPFRSKHTTAPKWMLSSTPLRETTATGTNWDGITPVTLAVTFENRV